MRRGNPIRISAAALLSIVLWIGATLAPTIARAAEGANGADRPDCHLGTLVTVVAHLDDDRHFHPDMEKAIRLVHSGAAIEAAPAVALPDVIGARP